MKVIDSWMFSGNLYLNLTYGEVPERLNGAVSKTVVFARVPRVRIPPSPKKSKILVDKIYFLIIIYVMKYKICLMLLATLFFIGSCAKDKNPLAAGEKDLAISAEDMILCGNIYNDGSGICWDCSFSFKDKKSLSLIKYAYAYVSDNDYSDKVNSCARLTNSSTKGGYYDNKLYQCFVLGGYGYTFDSTGKSGTAPYIKSLKLNGYINAGDIRYPDIEANIEYGNIDKLTIGEKYFSVYVYDIYGNRHTINKRITGVIIQFQEIVPYYEYMDINKPWEWMGSVSMGCWGELVSKSGNTATVKVKVNLYDYINLLSQDDGYYYWFWGTDKFIVKTIAVSDGSGSRSYEWTGIQYYDSDSGTGFTISGGGPLIVRYK